MAAQPVEAQELEAAHVALVVLEQYAGELPHEEAQVPAAAALLVQVGYHRQDVALHLYMWARAQPTRHQGTGRGTVAIFGRPKPLCRQTETLKCT